MGEHNDDGALGVVVNRPLDVTTRQAVPVLSDMIGPDEPLFEGGPVQPTGMVLLAEFGG